MLPLGPIMYNYWIFIFIYFFRIEAINYVLNISKKNKAFWFFRVPFHTLCWHWMMLAKAMQVFSMIKVKE